MTHGAEVVLTRLTDPSSLCSAMQSLALVATVLALWILLHSPLDLVTFLALGTRRRAWSWVASWAHVVLAGETNPSTHGVGRGTFAHVAEVLAFVLLLGPLERVTLFVVKRK